MATPARVIWLRNHREYSMVGREKLLQGGNGECRRPHKDEVHSDLPFDGFPLQPLPLAFEHLALDLAHPIPNEHPVQVIHLMLKRARK